MRCRYKYGVRSSDAFKYKVAIDSEFQILDVKTDKNEIDRVYGFIEAEGSSGITRGDLYRKLKYILLSFVRYFNFFWEITILIVSSSGQLSVFLSYL